MKPEKEKRIRRVRDIEEWEELPSSETMSGYTKSKKVRVTPKYPSKSSKRKQNFNESEGFDD
jgi:hypothetical protein